MERNQHVFILYALVAAVALWLLFDQFVQESPDAMGTWQCSNVVCSQSVGPEAWVQENCFLAPAENGSQAPFCRVVINEVPQLIPLAALNLTNVRQCVEYTCTQELNVRMVNYTINITQ
jgi:hypothetical protein